MRTFERALGKPAGYVVPVQRWGAQASPAGSASCGCCAVRLFLAPGDSPIGLRLPLSSLPHLAPIDYPHMVPADPFAPRLPLPDPAALEGWRPSRTTRGPLRRAPATEWPRNADASIVWCRRCGRPPPPPAIPRGDSGAHALAVEPPRRQALCVHAAVERLEIIWSSSRPRRRPPPSWVLLSVWKAIRRRTTRAQRHQGDAGSGVIEVNIHPSASWQKRSRPRPCCTSRPASRGSAPTSS